MVEAYNTADPLDAKRIAAIEKCGIIGDWDVSAITDMSDLFAGLAEFNEPLTNWDTSSVTTMAEMFRGAFAFNQPLNFDTSKVKTMSGMFAYASSFNQPLSFVTSSVTDMSWMFEYATAFNQPLRFNISSITDMSQMFENAGMNNANKLITRCLWEPLLKRKFGPNPGPSGLGPNPGVLTTPQSCTPTSPPRLPCVFTPATATLLKEMVLAYNTADPLDAKRIAAIEKCGILGDWDVSAITDMSELFI